MRFSVFLFLALFAFGSCQGSPSSTDDCLIPGSWLTAETICGTLRVPENHQEPGGRMITISYVVLKGRQGDKEAAPLIFLMGGPGGKTISKENIQAWLKAPILVDRDIILVDQRGIGFSSPLPDMGMTSFRILARDGDQAEELQWTREMIAEYSGKLKAAGIRPEYYNTIQNARDIGLLMEQLGYDKYCLMGGSYGTRLGRVIQDLYPDRLAAVVHDSPNPMNYDFLLDRLKSYSLALERVLDYCAKTPDCRAQYPDLRNTYLEAIASLKTEPLVEEFQGEAFAINAQDGIYLIRRNLYQSDSRESVPALIQALRDRDPAGVRDIIYSEYLLSKFLNLSMLLSVERYEAFHEENTAGRIQGVYRNYPLLPVPLGFFDAFYQAGMDWHQSTLAEEDKNFKVSEVPSLIMVNQYDPVTPPENGRLFQEKLPNSTLLILDEGGHGGGNEDCKDQVIRDFLKDPESQPDVSCLNLYEEARE